MLSIMRAATLTFAIMLFGSVQYALAAGLPPAPGAEQKASQGGLTAGASVQREGGSALEPYLITLLIPGFGLIIIAVSVVADRETRAKKPPLGPITEAVTQVGRKPPFL